MEKRINSLQKMSSIHPNSETSRYCAAGLACEAKLVEPCNGLAPAGSGCAIICCKMEENTLDTPDGLEETALPST